MESPYDPLAKCKYQGHDEKMRDRALQCGTHAREKGVVERGEVGKIGRGEVESACRIGEREMDPGRKAYEFGRSDGECLGHRPRKLVGPWRWEVGIGQGWLIGAPQECS